MENLFTDTNFCHVQKNQIVGAAKLLSATIAHLGKLIIR